MNTHITLSSKSGLISDIHMKYEPNTNGVGIYSTFVTSRADKAAEGSNAIKKSALFSVITNSSAYLSPAPIISEDSVTLYGGVRPGAVFDYFKHQDIYNSVFTEEEYKNIFKTIETFEDAVTGFENDMNNKAAIDNNTQPAAEQKLPRLFR